MSTGKTTREQVLQHIAAHPEGLRFVDIQRFVVENNGLNFDEKEPVRVWGPDGSVIGQKMVRRYRGYWCDNLCGNWMRRQGILSEFCTKLPSGRYVVTKPQIA